MIDRFPIIARELITRPRKRTFYLRRVLFLMAAGAGLLAGAQAGESMGSASGLYIFQILAYGAILLLPLFAMQQAAETLTAEKEDRTLGLLLLSRLTGRQIILSKLFAALTTSLFGLALLLPLFLLGVSLGGISSQQILLAFLLLLATVFLCAALGLLVGSLIHTRRNVGAGNVAAIFAVFAGPVIILYFIWHGNIRAPIEWGLAGINPLFAMASVIGDRNIESVITCIFLVTVIGLISLAFAFRLLPHQIFKEGRSGEMDDYEVLPMVRREFTRISKAARPAGNPVVWKDYHHALGGHSAAWLKFFVLTAVLSMLMLFHHQPLDFSVYLGLFSLYAATIAFFGCLFRCGRSFNREKRQRTLDMLLTTPLTARDIWTGKFKAAVLSVGPWLLCGGAGYFLLLLDPATTRDIRNLWTWLIVLVEFVIMLFAYSLLAMQLSLSLKRDRGLVLTLCVFFGYNTIGRAFAGVVSMGTQSMAPMLIIDLVFHGALILGISSGLTDSLRHHAMETAGA